MALVNPLIRSSSISDGCFGNFLNSKYGHLVTPNGNEIVFQDIDEKVAFQPVRARLSVQGTIHQLLTVPALYLMNNVSGLDGLLVYSRYTSDSHTIPVKDIIFIYQFNTTSSQLEVVKEFSFSVPEQPLTISNKVIISLNDKLDKDASSFVFYNGFNQEINVINLASGLRTIPLSKSKSRKDSLSKIFWVNSHTIVTVTETNFTSTLELHDLNKKPNKGKQPSTLVKSLPEIVKYICSGPTEGTILVMSSRRFQILKQTNKELKEGKEYQLEMTNGIRNWYYLSDTTDGDIFLISSEQEVLLVRKSGAPIQLNVQETKPGSIAHIGSSVFLLKSGGLYHFCRFRLNRKRTNIFVDFIGKQKLPPDDLELIGEHSFNMSKKTFWWKHSMCPNDGLVVSEAVWNVMSNHISTPYDGLVENIWKTSTSQHEWCYLVSTGEKTDLLVHEAGELKCLVQDSWQQCNKRTIFANEKSQITPSEIFWDSHESNVLSEPCFQAAGHGTTCVAANSEKALIYSKARLVREIEINDTIIDLACTENIVGVLTTEKVYIFDVVTCELRDISLSFFCCTLTIMSCGTLYVATPMGSVHCLATNKSNELPGTSIKKIMSIQDKLLVVDSSGRPFILTNQGIFLKMDCLLKNELVSFAGSTKFLTVYDGTVEILEFDFKDKFQYKSLQLNEFPFAESVKILDDTLIALQWGDQQVYTVNLAKSRKHEKHKIHRVDDGLDRNVQLFIVDLTHILVVESTIPADPMVSDSEQDEEEDPSYYEVPLTVKLYELDSKSTELRLLTKSCVTLPGDPFDETIVKFLPDHDEIGLFIFTQSMSSVHFTVNLSSHTVETREISAHCGSVYYDHWFRGDKKSTMIVTQNGRVLERTSPLMVDDESDNDAGTLREFDSDMVYDVIELESHGSIGKRFFAASIKRNPGEKECRVVIFSYCEEKVNIVATLHIPSRKISLVRASPSYGEKNKNRPTFYIGCCDGALYAVREILDSEQLRSLQEIQQQLLHEMGFGERAEKLATSIDGSLIETALMTPEVHDIILERIGSLDNVIQAVECMHS